MLVDQYKLHKRLRHIRSNEIAQLDKIKIACDQSIEQVLLRKSALPTPKFPQGLPVADHLDEIGKAIVAHQVVVIAGETGSGKTTQIPKLLLSLGFGARGLIGHTQPRRVAARRVAERIAEELEVPFGQQVGYQVRFQDNVSQNAYLKIMTDGILLAEIQHDPWLTQYEAIIIDEAHERSLNIDFLLGFLKNLCAHRPELKIIITSATLDHHRFSVFFNHCPVIEVPGRMYPVEVRYYDENNLETKIIDCVYEIIQLNKANQSRVARDTLLFLSGEKEIREISHILRQTFPHQFEILPLYSRLAQIEQDKIFKPSFKERIILSTNVAETSLTVPNIGYVIDSGDVRISRYSVRTKIQRLPIESIAKASADQRKGRCGRVAPGICFRLYTEEDFLKRPEFTEPEILRTNLASVILNLKLLGLGDIENFPFIEKPEERYIRDGYQLLQVLGALDAHKNITEQGKKIASMPVDPRLSRILLASHENHALKECLIIVSALSVQDPKERPIEKAIDADAKHAVWKEKKSDFLGFIKLWNDIEAARQEKTRSEFDKWCYKNYLAPMRVREWREVHWQLKLVCEKLRWEENKIEATYDQIHRALLTGLIEQVAQKNQEEGSYLATRGRKIFIHPQSSLFKNKPLWVVVFDIVETSKVYARVCAEIEVDAIVAIGKHLLQYNYFEPHYDARSERVKAFEQGSLFGLVLYRKKAVNLSELDPKTSRKVFICEALVPDKLNTPYEFMAHNRALIQYVHQLESKKRRKDLLVSPELLIDWYEQKLPACIVDGQALKPYIEKTKKENKKCEFLRFTLDDLLLQPVAQNMDYLFPDFISFKDNKFNIDYFFDYLEPKDGATIIIPVHLFEQVTVKNLSWIIPGWLDEKVLAVARNLPKDIRKAMHPLSEYVQEFVKNNAYNPIFSLFEIFKQELYQLKKCHLNEEIWQEAERGIDEYLRFNLRVIDRDGKVLVEGRDYSELYTHLLQTKRALLASNSYDIKTTGMPNYSSGIGWSFGDLPIDTVVKQKTGSFHAYPGLSQENDRYLVLSLPVQLKMYVTQNESEASIHRYLPVLLVNQLVDLNRVLKKTLAAHQKMITLSQCWVSFDEMNEQFLIAVSKITLIDLKCDVIRCEDKFNEVAKKARVFYLTHAETLRLLIMQILEKKVAVNFQLKGRGKPAFAKAVKDIQGCIDRLLIKGFLYEVEFDTLKRYPAFLSSMISRIEKMGEKWDKDQAAQKIIEQYEAHLVAAKNGKNPQVKKINEFEWMINELRVSFFSPQIKTAFSVSQKRLDQWLIDNKQI